MASRMATRRLCLLWRASSHQRRHRFLSTVKVEELYTKMVALTDDDLNLVGELLSERMGIPIPDFDSSAMSVAEEEDTEQATAATPVMEKTTLDVKLVGFDAKSKIKVIKEVRAAFGGSLGLKEAKELVEGAPTILKKDMKKEEAQELQKKLEEIGATIELV